MEERLPLGIKIFGIVEMTVGFIGTAILILSTLGFIECLLNPAKTEVGGSIAMMFMFVFSFAPFLLWAGNGVLARRKSSILINRIAAIIISVLAGIAIIYHIYYIVSANMLSHYSVAGRDFMSFIIADIVFFLILFLPIRWFLKNPEVKKHFD